MKTIVLAALLTLVTSTAGYSQKQMGVFTAVKYNDSTTVTMCLHAGLKANATGMGGHTLLMEASQHKSYAVAKLLLAHGAKVNAKDEMGNTALMEAAWKGDVLMASLLLQAGANAGLINTSGQTALSLATDANNNAVVELLAKETIIYHTAMRQ